MKKATLIISVILISINVFSGEVYRCDTDTLKLAYWYDNVYYDDNCDLQYADTLYLGTDADVWVYIDTVVIYPTYWYKYDSLNCQSDIIISDTIVNINSSGIYYVGYNTYAAGSRTFSRITVVRMDSTLLSNPHIKGLHSSEVEYEVSVPDVFNSYFWSNGDNDNLVNINQPGVYTLEVESFCNESFSHSIDFVSSDFLSGQFYAGQNTGVNVSYFDFEPDIQPEWEWQGHDCILDITLDLNMDNIQDINIYLHGQRACGFEERIFTVTPLNGSYIGIRNSLANKIDSGNIINNKLYWSNNDNNVLYLYDTYGGIPSCEYGFWDHNEIGYLPVRLNDGYVWLRLSTDNGFINTRIYDYAYMKDSTQNGEITDETISVYPNPASDFIQIDSQYDDLNVRIFDILGNCVYQNVLITRSNKLFIPELRGGLYLLMVNNNDVNRTFKLVKQ